MLEQLQKLPWLVRAKILQPFFQHLGPASYVGPPTYLSGLSRAYVGDRFRVFPGLRLEIMPGGQLRVGSDVALAQNVHITCGHRVSIGDGCRILPSVVITDITHGYRDPHLPLRAQVTTTKEVEIGDNCMIGAGAVLLPGTRLGPNCVVGANAVVTGVHPARSIVAGPRGVLISNF